jgi:DNA-binding PadR family transcriptional regulator
MAVAQVRMTIPTQLVLHALLVKPQRELYGLEICQAAGFPSGTIHPILARLERVGWLVSRWEDANPQVEGRPRRRYYKLTPEGIDEGRQALANARTQATGLMDVRPALIDGEV